MDASLMFVGNATTLLRIGSFTVLTDPNFLRRGQWAYLGWGLASRRLTDPAMDVAEVPTLDAVLLSHLHGDHWDRVARRGLDRSAPVVTTPHAARRLRRRGFDTMGLETWERATLTRGDEELKIAAMPGLHARGLLGAMLPPVMGGLLEHRRAGRTTLRVYISGDTLTGDHLDEVAERYPDIDAAIVHLGGTKVLSRTVTMDGAQGANAVRRVAPRMTFPVHYDDYGRFASPLSDFLDRAPNMPGVVRPVRRGETVPLMAVPVR
jgi:L-ascorbate metabolism protein UlaG (beta-lactamase superfamily)